MYITNAATNLTECVSSKLRALHLKLGDSPREQKKNPETEAHQKKCYQSSSEETNTLQPLSFYLSSTIQEARAQDARNANIRIYTCESTFPHLGHALDRQKLLGSNLTATFLRNKLCPLPLYGRTIAGLDILGRRRVVLTRGSSLL